MLSCPFSLLQSGIVPQSFLNFSVSRYFWRLQTSYFVKYPSVWVCLIYVPEIRLRWCIFVRNITEATCSFHCTLKGSAQFLFVTLLETVNRDCLLKVMSTRFPYCKITHSLFMISMWEMVVSDYVISCFLSISHPLVLASIYASWRN